MTLRGPARSAGRALKSLHVRVLRMLNGGRPKAHKMGSLPPAVMTTLRSILLLPLLAIVSIQAQQPAAVPPAPVPSQLTFKVDVNYVEIDATVTDRQGNPVLDLSRDDFEVLEEGKPQAVTVFSRVDLPLERHDPPLFRAAAVEPDVRSNKREFDGRVFVLLLDDLHTSFARTSRLRAAATAFISHHLGANDIAAVMYTSAAGDRSQEFTSSRPLLLRAVNRFLGQRLPSGAAGRGTC
jgi:hypothetical protein